MKKWFCRKFKEDKSKKEILDFTLENWLEGESKVGYITHLSIIGRGEGWKYKWME